MSSRARFACFALLSTGVLLAASVRTASAQMTEESLSLRVGEQTTLSAEGVQNYSEGARGIVQVRVTPDGRRFIIVGVQPGSTSLLLLMRDGSQTRYTMQVSAPDDAPQTGATLEARDSIRLDLYFVQLTDTGTMNIGIGWPSTFLNAATSKLTVNVNHTFSTPSSTVTTAAMSAEAALPRLDLFQSVGWARILRHAMLVTSNGAQADFQSGSEINVQVQGTQTGDIRQIRYGTNVGMTPNYDPDTGRIEILINTEVSDITSGNPPGRDITSMRATVNLEPGQSLVLGGLQSESEQNTKAGLPYLSQIPILGILFGSHGTQTQRIENVLVIVPSVVQPVGREAGRRIEEVLQIYRDYRGGIGERGAGLVDSPRRPRRRARSTTTN